MEISVPHPMNISLSDKVKILRESMRAYETAGVLLPLR